MRLSISHHPKGAIKSSLSPKSESKSIESQGEFTYLRCTVLDLQS